MAIFALSDLHLSFQVDKPMDIFGASWQNYEDKIAQNWKQQVQDTDVVLIPGDVSWGTYLEQAEADFQWISNLPGIKYISKGNHDYWWETVTKMNTFLQDKSIRTIEFVYNSAFLVGDTVVCAAKGYEKETEERLQNRERIRLLNSLQAGQKLNGTKTVVMLHYPPFYRNGEPIAEIHALLQQFHVDVCLYGHIHNKGFTCPKDETVNGVRFMLVSCDQVDFCPVRVAF